MRRKATSRLASTLTGGETVKAFVPLPLPPIPPLELSGDRQGLLERATLALGRLDNIAFPNCAAKPTPINKLCATCRRTDLSNKDSS